MTKTYKECLDEVAKKRGFIDMNDAHCTTRWPSAINSLYKEAAMIYGEAKFNEGVQEQRAIIVRHLPEAHILRKPTFKP